MRNSDKEKSVGIIQALDFSDIKKKLGLQAPEGKGWTMKQINIVEKWYKRFLILNVKYPDHKHVPNEPIDIFWHYHILDTRKYQRDCQSVFGELLHHYPYFGLNGDAEVRDEAFELTNQLYRIEFGEDCTQMFKSKNMKVMAGEKCNSGGSGTGCGQGCSGGGK